MGTRRPSWIRSRDAVSLVYSSGFLRNGNLENIFCDIYCDRRIFHFWTPPGNVYVQLTLAHRCRIKSQEESIPSSGTRSLRIYFKSANTCSVLVDKRAAASDSFSPDRTGLSRWLSLPGQDFASVGSSKVGAQQRGPNGMTFNPATRYRSWSRNDTHNVELSGGTAKSPPEPPAQFPIKYGIPKLRRRPLEFWVRLRL